MQFSLYFIIPPNVATFQPSHVPFAECDYASIKLKVLERVELDGLAREDANQKLIKKEFEWTVKLDTWVSNGGLNLLPQDLHGFHEMMKELKEELRVKTWQLKEKEEEVKEKARELEEKEKEELELMWFYSSLSQSQ